MLSTWKYMLLLALAPPAVYAFAPSHLENVGAVITKSLTPRPDPNVAPVDPVAAASVDEDLDYRIAQRTKSPEGWRAFLTAHPDGPHARSARDEMDRLAGVALAAVHEPGVGRPASETPGEAASPQDRPSAGLEAAAPPAEAAALPSDETCRGDQERLERLSKNPTGDGVIRFLIELRCEKLRPQALELAGWLDVKAPASVAAADTAEAPTSADTAEAPTSGPTPAPGLSTAPLPPPRIWANESQKRARPSLASRSARPKRQANPWAAHNLPQLLSALFGQKAGRRP